MQGFDQLAQIESANVTTIMDKFPGILKGLDLEKVGRTSIWLAKQVPPPQEEQRETEVAMDGFRFFETDWTGPSQTRAGQAPA